MSKLRYWPLLMVGDNGEFGLRFSWTFAIVFWGTINEGKCPIAQTDLANMEVFKSTSKSRTDTTICTISNTWYPCGSFLAAWAARYPCQAEMMNRTMISGRDHFLCSLGESDYCCANVFVMVLSAIGICSKHLLLRGYNRWCFNDSVPSLAPILLLSFSLWWRRRF